MAGPARPHATPMDSNCSLSKVIRLSNIFSSGLQNWVNSLLLNCKQDSFAFFSSKLKVTEFLNSETMGYIDDNF